MTTPTKEELKSKIREFLSENEEDTVKLKVVRATLEKHFGVDLKDRKDEVRSLVTKVNNESGEESESEDEEIPVTRKKKKKKKKRKRGDDDDEEEERRPKKKRKVKFVELSDNGLKRVKVQRYQGKLQVHIRNHYRKDDDVLPTKRGIALSVEEWEVLKENFEVVDKMVDDMR